MARQTDEFYAEIRRSHTVISYVDVIGADLEIIRLSAIDGEVNVDGTAEFRRKLSVNCVDPTGRLTPRTEGEILTPYGTELRPYRGIRYADGETEVCPLGVFRLSKSDVSDVSSGPPTIKLEAFDRSRVVARDKFIVPYVIAVGTNVLTAIKEIVQQTFPDAEYDSISTTMLTTAPMLFDAGDSPWAAVSTLATSIGCQIYFDVEGRIAIVPPDDINSLPAPDFSYIEGQGCIMTDMTRVYTDEPGFNGVIVTGESVGDELPPVRGEAWDMEPTSPTYRYGPYGEVPMFHTDPLVKTAEQAATVANGLLAGRIGSSSQLGITAGVNPSYEAGDVVQVVRPRSGVSGLYALDAFNVPLKHDGTQGLSLRERRVTSS